MCIKYINVTNVTIMIEDLKILHELKTDVKFFTVLIASSDLVV